MNSLLGIVVVFAAVLGGFALSGGPMIVLFQPYELMVIGGAALGTLFISAPGKVRSRVFAALKQSLKPTMPAKSDFVDLLKLLFEIFTLMRRQGVLSLEEHLAKPEASAIFKKYPSVLHKHHAFVFMTDGLRQLVDGCSADELLLLLDIDIETQREEEHQPISLLKTIGDSLPGLGIVAAVLGIVITMAHLDGGPEEIGHHVAAALVGTFLGILLCYGLISPLATNVEQQGMAMSKYVRAIQAGLLAAARGSTPTVAVEFARRSIFTDERPSAEELEKAFASLQASA